MAVKVIENIKQTCCSKPHLIINTEQVGKCKNCGALKIFPDNIKIEKAIMKKVHHSYPVKTEDF